MPLDLESQPVNGRAGGHGDPSHADPDAGMHVRKRNGRLEPVDVNKIVRAVRRSAGGLGSVDIMRIAVKTIGGLFDGATTRQLDQLSIQTAASLIAEEPEYSQLAARLLDAYIAKAQPFAQPVLNGSTPLGAFNSDIFSAVTVLKSPSAAEQPGGLSGNIDLRILPVLQRKDGGGVTIGNVGSVDVTIGHVERSVGVD